MQTSGTDQSAAPLTPLEMRLYTTAQNALNLLTARRVGHDEYMELLEDLKNVVGHVENIIHGCPKGRHRNAEACRCIHK
jgi:hypothetical protein